MQSSSESIVMRILLCWYWRYLFLQSLIVMGNSEWPLTYSMNSELDRHHYWVGLLRLFKLTVTSDKVLCSVPHILYMLQIMDGWIDGSVMTRHFLFSSRVKESHKFILQKENEKHVILDTSIPCPSCTLSSASLSPLIGTHCNTSHSGLLSPTLSMLLTLGTSSLPWPSGTVLSRMLIILSIRSECFCSL